MAAAIRATRATHPQPNAEVEAANASEDGPQRLTFHFNDPTNTDTLTHITWGRGKPVPSDNAKVRARDQFGPALMRVCALLKHRADCATADAPAAVRGGRANDNALQAGEAKAVEGLFNVPKWNSRWSALGPWARQLYKRDAKGVRPWQFLLKGEMTGSRKNASYTITLLPNGIAKGDQIQFYRNGEPCELSTIRDMLARWGLIEMAAQGMHIAARPTNAPEALTPMREAETPMPEALTQLREAISLSRSTLIRDPGLLASQLIGRLADAGNGQVQSLLKQFRETERSPWLEPLDASLRRCSEILPPGVSRNDRALTALVVVSPRGGQNGVTMVLGGRLDGSFCVWRWNSPSGKPSCTDLSQDAEQDAERIGVSALAVLPAKGNALPRFVSAGFGEEGRLALWQFENQGEHAMETTFASIHSPIRAVACVSLQPTASLVVAGTESGELWCWSINEPSYTCRIGDTKDCHEGWINALAVVPPPKNVEQQGIASAGFDGNIRLWEWDRQKVQWSSRVVGCHGGPVRGLLVARLPNDGEDKDCRVVSVGCDGQAKAWSLGHATPLPRPLLELSLGERPVVGCAAINAGGRTQGLVSIADTGLVRFTPFPAAARGNEQGRGAGTGPHSTGFLADAVAGQVCVIESSQDSGSDPMVIVGDGHGVLHRLRLRMSEA